MVRPVLSTRRRLLIVLAVVFVSTGCSAAGHGDETDPLQAQAAFEQGVQALGRNEWAAAMTALSRATTLAPNVAVYRDRFGLSLLQLGQPQPALDQFRKATEIDRGFADGYLHAGIALAEQGRWAEAVEAYRKAIPLPRLTEPDTAHADLGFALLNLGRYQDAEQELRFALELDPQIDAAWYHLGVALLSMGRTDEAKEAFRRARELAPGSPFGQAAVERLKTLGDGG